MKAYKVITIALVIILITTGLMTYDFTKSDSVLIDTKGSLVVDGVYEKPSKQSVAASNEFGLELLKKSFDETTNTVVSPTSFYLAFAMLYNGASGETKAQMYKAMNITQDIEAFNEEMKSLQESLLAERQDTVLMLANSIWIRDSFKDFIRPEFLGRNAKYYGAMVEACDFSNSNTVKKINNWVSENTNGLIDSVISTIDPMTVMFIINTVYLKAKWQIPFDAASTYSADFYALDGTIRVDTMHKLDRYEFYSDREIKAIKLPYTDGRSYMLVVLPNQDIQSFIGNVTDSYLDNIVSNMQSRRVNLALPKVDIKTEMHPISELMELGMVDMFDIRANFGELAEMAQNGELCVGDVLHKTVLKIDESGTEATAVTVIDIRATGMPIIEEYESMIVNRPFFIAVIDGEAGIMFTGTIMNPTK